MRLIKSILSSAWMIDEQFAIGLSPLLQALVSGKEVSLEQYAIKSEVKMIESAYGGSVEGSDKRKSIAYLPVKGVIMKDDYCGDMGLKTMEARINQYAADDSIGSILLEFDTPGGEASYLPIIAKSIREAREMKPVIGFINGGMSASAGYYMLSQCSHAFVGSKTDIVGSVGTMIQMVSEGPKLKEKFVIHNINATKSTDKNKPFMEAMKGKYALIRSEILDPMNEEFHANVRLGRPQVSEEVFTGKTYMYEQAMELGMIDGMKSFEEVIQFASELIENPQNEAAMNFKLFNRNKPESKMKNERISTILGRDFHDGDVLTAEEVVLVDAALAAPAPVAAAVVETQEPSMAEMITGAVASAVAPLQETIKALEARVAVAEGKPATPSAGEGIPPVEGASEESFENEPWNDPSNPVNLAAKKQLGM